MPSSEWTLESRYRRVMLGWYRTRARSFPWRDTRDPYAVLIGEVMLQRTRGENAAGAYELFMRKWPDPLSLAGASTEDIVDVVRPLGLVKRVEMIARLGQALAENDGVPRTPKDLAKLPGVGPYVAHSVPVFAWGDSLPVVDWVIARVLRRYFGLSSHLRPNADSALWQRAQRLANPGRARPLWLGTLDFAASVCTPRPKCAACPLSGHCAFNLGGDLR